MDSRKIQERLNNILHKDEEYKNYKIEYIFHYKDSDDYEAIAFDGEDIASIFFKSEKIEPLINSLYDLDDEIFGSLEKMQGEIAYMSFDTHNGVWNYINDNIYDINNFYGMQCYLKYCKENNITKSSIDNKTKLNVPDVMKYYKNREIKILGMWETDYGDIACNALLLENNKKVANIIENYDIDKKEIIGKIYDNFDNFLVLPKISNYSKLMQSIYDTVCQSDSSMCHITDEDWKEDYADEYSEKDIEKLKEEVKELGIDKLITFNDAEYKIIGWGDLYTVFNDDRNIGIDKDYNNVNDNPDIEMGNLFMFDNYICEIDDYNQENPNESIVFIYESLNKFENRDYIEQVSLLNKNIKENIEDYMEEKYDVKIVTRLSLLREVKDIIAQNLYIYSDNYLMSEPRKGYEREWRITNQKNHILDQMIREEEIKRENKQKEKWKEEKLI